MLAVCVGHTKLKTTSTHSNVRGEKIQKKKKKKTHKNNVINERGQGLFENMFSFFLNVWFHSGSMAPMWILLALGSEDPEHVNSDMSTRD